MAISERLAYILDFDVRSGVKSLEKVGATADKELKKVEDRTDKAAANLTKFGVGALAIAGSAGVGLAKMAQGAAETDANLSALNQVLGETVALNIEKWAEDGATAVGLSERAIYSAATSFGQLGKVAGFAGAELEAFTKRQVTLAADMAAFKDVSPEQAIQDLTAAYAGSSETLQKYNVFVNDTNIKAALQKETGEKVTGTLTSQQRVMGINLLLMEQTVDIQGQWSRESGGLAGQMATAKAELTNLSDEIGAAAIPVMVEMLGVVRQGIGAFNSLNDATGGNLGTIAVWGVAITGAVGGISALAGQVIKARDSIKSFATEMTTAKASVIGVTTVVTVGILAYQQYAKRKQEAIARTNEFITALGGEADAQNEAIDSLIAGKFASESYADALDKAGLSIADIVRVARGETVPAFEKLSDTLDAGGTALFRLTDGSAATESELRALVRAAEAERTALGNARTETERKATATDELGRKTEMYTEFAKGMRGELVGVGDDAATAAEGVDALNISMTGTQSSAQQVDAAIRAAAGRLKRFGDDGVEQMGEVDEAVDEVKNSFIELRTEIENRGAYRDLQSGFDNIENAAVEAYTAAAEGADDAEQKARDYQQAIDDQTLAVLEYGEGIGNIPDEILTDIVALIDQGKFAEAERMLELLTRERELRVNVKINSAGQKFNVGPGLVITPGVVGAQGGIVNSPTTALIGEAGPEAVIPLDKVPGNQSIGDLLGGGGGDGDGGDSVTVYAPTTIYNAVSVEAVDPGSFFYDLERMARGLG